MQSTENNMQNRKILCRVYGKENASKKIYAKYWTQICIDIQIDHHDAKKKKIQQTS
jgi:hypothetical protein